MTLMLIFNPFKEIHAKWDIYETFYNFFYLEQLIKFHIQKMASKIKVKIKRARDLPVMDRNQHVDASTDAFVEVKIDEQEYKTQVIKKSLNPQWGEEFTFEFVDDSVLQTSPVEIKVLNI